MFKNLTASLILNGQITTTREKAMELRSYADKMISLSKNGTPYARKLAASFLNDNEEVVDKLFREYPIRFQYRPCGYTRVKPIGFRRGDKAAMAVIEYIRDDLYMQPSDYTCNLQKTQEINDENATLNRE